MLTPDLPTWRLSRADGIGGTLHIPTGSRGLPCIFDLLDVTGVVFVPSTAALFNA